MIGDEVALENDQLSVSERDSFVRVSVVRTGELSSAATIEFGVTNEGAEDGVNGDYLLAPSDDVTLTGPLSGVLTLQPGQSRGEIVLTINDDAASESTETFVVALINVEGATLTAPRTTRVDILDDENPVTDPGRPPLESPYDVTLNSVVEGLQQPLSFEFSPVEPSILLVAEKRGVIKAFDMSPLETGGDPIELDRVLDIRSITNDRQDRGLLDIAIHPDVENYPYLYVFVVIDPPAEVDPVTGEILQPGVDDFGGNAGPNGGGNRFSHLIRYTLDEATNYTTIIEGSEEVILGGGAQYLSDISGNGVIDSTNPSSLDTVAAVPTDVADFSDVGSPVFIDDVVKVDSRSHAGGALAFGPDGALYVSNGDGTSFNFADRRTYYAQDVNSLAGKILRIDPVTGEGLADNPFVEVGDDLSANKSKVYQLGLRNPFSMGFDDDSDLLITDTG